MNTVMTLGQATRLADFEYNVGGKWCIPTGAINFGGVAICSALGARNRVQFNETEGCLKIDTHRSFSLFTDNYTDLMFLWDPKKELIVSVDMGDYFSTLVKLSQFDSHAWACNKTLQLAASYCRSIQRLDEEYRLSVQSLIEKCRARVGCPVIVVRGRKVAKGTQTTITRLVFGNFGWSAQLSSGEWTAITNLSPNILKPTDERLDFYYDRREQYFMEGHK